MAGSVGAGVAAARATGGITGPTDFAGKPSHEHDLFSVRRACLERGFVLTDRPVKLRLSAVSRYPGTRADNLADHPPRRDPTLHH